MAITPLPPAPLPTDSTSQFNTKAFAFVGALDDFVTETNALAVEVDADKTTASNAATTATNAANTATTKASEASADADAAAASAVEAAGLVENYQGALASDPALNKDGGALAAGDWYVNTSTGLIRAYDGSQWVTSVNVTAGVSSFSAGTTGLTPNGVTQGTITLGGTLNVANGGTGITSFGSGIATFLGTPSSANLASAVTDETGSGALVFATSPTLVTPVLGTPTSGNLSNCTVDGTNAVGFRILPQNSQSANYTLVADDSGKHILHPSADTTARTFTIPSNGSVPYPVGTAITFVNQNGAGIVTIAITTDTMRLAGAGTTGSRTLAANGVATAIKVTSTEWIISGTGLT